MRGLQLLLACCILSVCACGKGGPAPHADEPAIRTFLNSYFSTWSANDMAGYGGCFLPNARVTFVDAGGASVSQGLTDFLHSQKMSHAQAGFPMHEAPTEMTISGDNRVAQAAVRWKLTKGPETVTGTDYFTLIKTSEGWRIIALVFFNDAP